MNHNLRCITIAIVFALVVLLAPASMVNAAVENAPIVQELRATKVTGVLTGGQFAKIWLGLEPTTPGADIRVLAEWDRPNALNSGLGFYLLDETGLNQVLSGTLAREVSLASGNDVFQGSSNQMDARFNAFGLSTYTIVVFNDSQTDAAFTLTVENATIVDGSNQVTDPTAPVVEETEGDGEEDGEEDGEDAGDDSATTTTEETSPAPAAPAAIEATETATEESATDESTTQEDTEATEETAVTVNASGVVRSTEIKGELPNLNDQHYLGLEPSEKDGSIVLTLTFDPQDNSELARRLNIWVFDQHGFSQFLGGSRASDVAVSAGNRIFGGATNLREARFKAVGTGPYTVLAYNSSSVPATYNLKVEGGVLIDESGQTQSVELISSTLSVTSVITPTESTEDAEDTSTADTSTTASTATTTTPSSTTTTAPATTTTRQGEPGGTYTIQRGDTLSLVARDIYGQLLYYRQICAFNGLADCNRVEVGDVIRLPTQAQIDELGSNPTSASAQATQTTTPATSTTEDTADESATDESTTDESATDESTDDGSTTEAETTADQDTTEAETTEETDSEEAETGATQDIIDTLESIGGFEQLLEAIADANLVTALRGDGPFTLFAPTDAAFNELPQGTLEGLKANPAGQLTSIILYHVLPSRTLKVAELTDGQSEVTAEKSTTVVFTISGSTVTINDANIVDADIEASNGIIHAIDTIIAPPPSETTDSTSSG